MIMQVLSCFSVNFLDFGEILSCSMDYQLPLAWPLVVFGHLDYDFTHNTLESPNWKPNCSFNIYVVGSIQALQCIAGNHKSMGQNTTDCQIL